MEMIAWDFFLHLWCHFHNSRENRLATIKPASFSTQAIVIYHITCSQIVMINMRVWAQTGWVCTHACVCIHTSTAIRWLMHIPRAKVSLKVTRAALTPITICMYVCTHMRGVHLSCCCRNRISLLFFLNLLRRDFTCILTTVMNPVPVLFPGL